MTPGEIDLKVVRDRLLLVKQSLDDLRSLPHTNLDEFTSDRRNILAADAALRRGLEALFDVARHLLAKGHGVGSLEYREVGAYLAGRKNRRQMVDDLAIAIGRFAKRQETWFRGMERRGTPITWIEPGDAGRILEDVAEWVGEG